MAKGYNVCDLDFMKSVGKIKSLFKKNIKSQLKDVQGNFKDQPKVIEKYIDDYLEDMDQGLQDILTSGDRGKIDDEVIANAKGNIKRSMIDLMNTFKTNNENIEVLNKLTEGLTKEGQIGEAVVSFFQRTENLTKAEALRFQNLVDNAIDNIGVDGFKNNPDLNLQVKKLWKSLVEGGDELQDLLRQRGITDPEKEIYMALKTGNSSIPELGAMARAFKFIDGEAASRAVKLAPYFNELSDHVLPIRTDKMKLEAQGFDKFKNFMHKYADLDALTDGNKDNAIKVGLTIRGLFDEMISEKSFSASSGFKKTTNLFGHRKIHFENDEAEYAFLKLFGRMDKGIMGGALAHRKNLLKKIVSYDLHGANVEFNAYNMAKFLEAKGIGYEASKRMVDKGMAKMKTYQGEMTQQEETASLAAKSASNLVSSVLTGASFVRNMMFDNTIYTGIVSGMLQKNNILGEIMKATWALGKATLKRGETAKLADALETQGLAIQISQNQLYQDIVGDMVSAGKQKDTKLGKIHNVTEKLAEGVSKYGTADATLRASRTSQAINAGSMILKGLNTAFDDLPTGIQIALKQANIGDAEWRILKKAPKFQNPNNGKDIMLDINKFEDISDIALKQIQKPLESLEDVRKRLNYSYQQVMTELTNELSAITSLKGDLPYKWGLEMKGVGEWLRLAFKFSNIAQSQWFNLMRVANRAAGLNPNVTGGTFGGAVDFSLLPLAVKDTKLAAQVIAGTVTGGLFTIWMNDIMKGKTPRQLSPKVALDAALGNGAGGLISILANNAYYNDDIISTPVSSVGKPIKSAGQNLIQGKTGQAAKHAAKMVPYLNLWYTRAATEALFREGLKVPPTPWERRLMREQDQKHIIK